MRKSKEHAADRMGLRVLRDESEAVYVSNLPKFARDVEPGWYPEGWLGYCMLPWPWHTRPFLEGQKA